MQQRRERLNAETADQRDARLQQTRELVRERRATETAEQRDARLQQLRELAREQRATEPGCTVLCARVHDSYRQT